MRLWTQVTAVLGLMASIPIIGLAGPPGGRAFAAPGSISGPAPLGASGPAPIGASGNLLGAPFRGGASTAAGMSRGGRNNGGNRNPGGVHNGGGRSDFHRFVGPVFYTPFYDSFGDYAGSPYDNGSYGADPGPDPSMQNVVQSQGQLNDQIRRLSNEIQELRENQASNPPSETQTVSENGNTPNQVPSAPPVTLVLHSGQKLQIQNYAVMDGIFWDFSKQPARKIPLSEIDVAASVQSTQANGGEFPDLREGNQAEN